MRSVFEPTPCRWHRVFIPAPLQVLCERMSDQAHTLSLDNTCRADAAFAAERLQKQMPKRRIDCDSKPCPITKNISNARLRLEIR